MPVSQLLGEKSVTFSKELLDILACPACKGEVRLREDRQGVMCPTCRLVYPVRDGIPVMLVEEAERVVEK